jgi:hypothetical protein
MTKVSSTVLIIYRKLATGYKEIQPVCRTEASNTPVHFSPPRPLDRLGLEEAPAAHGALPRRRACSPPPARRPSSLAPFPSSCSSSLPRNDRAQHGRTRPRWPPEMCCSDLCRTLSIPDILRICWCTHGFNFVVSASLFPSVASCCLGSPVANLDLHEEPATRSSIDACSGLTDVCIRTCEIADGSAHARWIYVHVHHVSCSICACMLDGY